MINICLNCHKYVFDGQNVGKFAKRLTTIEYLKGVVCNERRENRSELSYYQEFNLAKEWRANKCECELCGAPHAIFTTEDRRFITDLRFFFSGLKKPCEKDNQFIEHFKQTYLV